MRYRSKCSGASRWHDDRTCSTKLLKSQPNLELEFIRDPGRLG